MVVERRRDQALLPAEETHRGFGVDDGMPGGGAPQLAPALLVDRRAPAPDLLADGFRGRDSPEALGGRVEVQDDAVLADVDDRLGGVLDGVHGCLLYTSDAADDLLCV